MAFNPKKIIPMRFLVLLVFFFGMLLNFEAHSNPGGKMKCGGRSVLTHERFNLVYQHYLVGHQWYYSPSSGRVNESSENNLEILNRTGYGLVFRAITPRHLAIRIGGGYEILEYQLSDLFFNQSSITFSAKRNDIVADIGFEQDFHIGTRLRMYLGPTINGRLEGTTFEELSHLDESYSPRFRLGASMNVGIYLRFLKVMTAGFDGALQFLPHRFQITDNTGFSQDYKVNSFGVNCRASLGFAF